MPNAFYGLPQIAAARKLGSNNLLALLFALLVSNGAGGLASGLARGLAFAAAALTSALLKSGFCDSLNKFHAYLSFLILLFTFFSGLPI